MAKNVKAKDRAASARNRKATERAAAKEKDGEARKALLKSSK
jgi:hypothetical protein